LLLRSPTAVTMFAIVVVVAIAATSVAAAKPEPGVEIAAAGDVTLGRAGRYPPGGPEQLFAGVRALVRAPISLGNLETTLVDPAAPLASKCGLSSTDCYAFSAPERFAHGLRRVGFTAFTVANNHSNDYGAGGRVRTVAALERAGLRTTGGPTQVTVVHTGGMRVALVGFAPYASSANLLDLRAARRLVQSASRRADIVVVTMHLGAEGTDRTHVPRGPEYYLGEARGDARAFSHAVVEAGADLVVGHGPHVLRGMEWYRGRLIAYSLGNFSGYHTLELVGPLSYSAVLRVKLDAQGRFVRGRLVPTRLVGSGTPTIDPSRTSVVLVRRLSREDFGPTAARLDADGSIR
jgi:poly-gamma-glutamate capsule biosynthesis protein CapA/YwtB (metallophosphatase superfamily)